MCSMLLAGGGQYKRRFQRNPVDREMRDSKEGLPRRRWKDALIVVTEIIALHRRCNDKLARRREFEQAMRTSMTLLSLA